MNAELTIKNALTA